MSVLERAKATKDLSNLRQIGAATQMYLNDKDGVLPAYGNLASWMTQLARDLSKIPSGHGRFSNRLLISEPASEADTRDRLATASIVTCISRPSGIAVT